MFAVQIDGQTVTREYLCSRGHDDFAAMIPGAVDYDRAEYHDEMIANEICEVWQTYFVDDDVKVVEL